MNKSIIAMTEEFPPEGGGAASIAASFYYYLSKDEGTKSLFFVGRMKAPIVANAVNIDVNREKWLINYGKIFRKYKKEFKDSERIILLDFWSSIAAGLFLDKSNLSKVVMILHGSEPEAVYYSGLRSIPLKLAYKRLLKHCMGVYAVSHFMKQKLLAVLRKKEPYLLNKIKQKIKVQYAGLPQIYLNYTNSKAVDIKRMHGINENDKVIFTASRIVKEKGLSYILDSLLPKLRDDWSWVIAGDGPYLKELETKVRYHNLTKVHFLGKKSPQEISNYYSQCDAFVLISFFKEAFGLVYIEANSFGTPVVASNIGGSIEAVADGVSGIIHIPYENNLILDINKAMAIKKESCIAHSALFNFKSFYNTLVNKVD